MPDPFLPGLRRVVCAGELTNFERWSNTFHLDDNVDLTQARADDIAGLFADFYIAMDAELATAWNFDTCTVYDRSEAGGASFEGSFTTVSGLQTEAQFQQIAVVLTQMTGIPGRSFRGRTYLAGMATTAFSRASAGDPMLVTATAIDAILDGAEALQAGLLAIGLIWVVFSRVGTGDVNAVSAVRVGTVPDTQRRRRNEIPEVYTQRDL